MCRATYHSHGNQLISSNMILSASDSGSWSYPVHSPSKISTFQNCALTVTFEREIDPLPLLQTALQISLPEPSQTLSATLSATTYCSCSFCHFSNRRMAAAATVCRVAVSAVLKLMASTELKDLKQLSHKADISMSTLWGKVLRFSSAHARSELVPGYHCTGPRASIPAPRTS